MTGLVLYKQPRRGGLVLEVLRQALLVSVPRLSNAAIAKRQEGLL